MLLHRVNPWYLVAGATAVAWTRLILRHTARKPWVDPR